MRAFFCYNPQQNDIIFTQLCYKFEPTKKMILDELAKMQIPYMVVSCRYSAGDPDKSKVSISGTIYTVMINSSDMPKGRVRKDKLGGFVTYQEEKENGRDYPYDLMEYELDHRECLEFRKRNNQGKYNVKHTLGNDTIYEPLWCDFAKEYKKIQSEKKKRNKELNIS